ncbi:hypothetical protein Nepgr_027693 [Nepenthes gracilis]|uniref:Uncharacterized protein n=1 Tax=Nepenthes gracilis TaxID=150966 RepID=A0AAD3T901_NEPGR|nr:hypothetical protein Nepgr_027693 [Nepenthes gracilis]
MIAFKTAKTLSPNQQDAAMNNKKRRVGNIDSMISFRRDNMSHVQVPHSDPLVVSALVLDVYNAILGRPCLSTFGAVTSIPHLKIKFPTSFGVGEVLGDQVINRTCYLSQITQDVLDRPIEGLDYRDETTLQQAQFCETTDLIPLNPSDLEKCIQIGSMLAEPLREQLTHFLRQNRDVFAWSLTNMPGISTEVIVHKLGLDVSQKPVKQK